MTKKMLIALLWVPFACFAQNETENWTGYYSYNNIKDISSGDQMIYASAENAFFTYNELGELSKISSVNGLSGKTITTSLFDIETNRLVLGHEDGSFQVYTEDTQDVLQVVDILEKVTISPGVKKINHFLRYGDFIYIASDFGISLYDINELEFDDTYFIGENGAQVQVRQTAITNDFIYAATNDGLYAAPVMNDDLIDFDQWQRIRVGDYTTVTTFNGLVYLGDTSRQIVSFDGTTFSVLTQLPRQILDVEVSDGFLVLTTDDQVYVYDADFQEVLNIDSFIEYPEVTFTTAISVGNDLFLGTTEFGILKTSILNTAMVEEIHPSGPLRNNGFAIKKATQRLWAVFGQYNLFYNPFALGGLNEFGISILNEGIWETIPFADAFNARVLSSISIDPNDETHLYIGSYHEGLLELQDNTPAALFNGMNTPEIEDTDPNNDNNMDYRVGDGVFADNGDYWFTVSQAHRVRYDLVVRRTDGSFRGFDADDVLIESNNGCSNIITTSNNTLFFGAEANGLVGFNEGNAEAGRFRIIGEEGLPDVNVRTLALDNNGRLWIGTSAGLRVLFNTANFFDPENLPEPQPIIILDDGEASELLFQQFITDIEVDGSNNKWVGTVDSGIFYFSPDGQETIHQFTEDNSPLPSNNINDIEIDGLTGEVFIATNRGMLSFSGTATDPSDDLSEVYAYPNPVRPGFAGNLTIAGLTSRANVKITDIEGNLVFETTSEGGSIEWDLTAFGRHRVASGVYLVLVSSQDGEDSTIKKVMVVR